MSEPKTIGIIGQGYVGLPLAMSAFSAGWNVIGIDNDEAKLDRIRKFRSPVEDIDDGVIAQAFKSGSYRITTDYGKVSDCEIVVLCLPTPLDSSGKIPDIGILERVTIEIAPSISPGTLVVNESTSFPGTLRNIIMPLMLKNNKHGEIHFAIAPERVDPSNREWSHRNTPRLVSGIDSESTIKAVNFYKSICDSVIEVTTPEVAEYAKLLENSFRQVNIALVTEISRLCFLDGVSVFEVIDAASSKPYGFMPFRPSVGVGGHCIPIDPLYLSWYAEQKELDLSLVRTSHEINQNQPQYVFERIKSSHPNSNTRILLNGIAYKKGVSDLRESPNLELLKKLRTFYKSVKWRDESVTTYEGEVNADLSEEFDLLVLAHPMSESALEAIDTRKTAIFDCTGSHLVSRKKGLSL